MRTKSNHSSEGNGFKRSITTFNGGLKRVGNGFKRSITTFNGGMNRVGKKIPYDKENIFHRLIRTVLIIIASLTIFVLIWWNVSYIVNSAAIPLPTQVWTAFVNLFSYGDPISGMTMWAHIGISLERFLGGFVLAMLVAVPMGLLMGSSKTLSEFMNPMLEILRPIAPIAWAPVLLFATGYTWGPMLVVFIGIFFPLLSNTTFGVTKIDRNLIDASKTLGASKAQIFYKVMFPCALPYIMYGVKIGSGIGWMCIVASELYASYGGGIGYFVGIQASIGFWPNVFVGIGIIAVLGILTTGMFEYVHKVLTKRMGIE
ncbi:taurine transporter subunit [Candidatus Methanoplasma termitum]|uniref:Taurine transporter subunit n=1 Tax=Candidatus Methanoplasma termitum TaxID=1577791 RepID=A0A0A7LDK2_9ARCH|nr:ABC transporter permease [Candidatus Methanoplasma termitum]AIZ56407.1 taurine transporter subunit [Candidatus Methanoplasma termitum]MCL2333876.1 ABC transporter permease [Candidatus Methanoplasma sp.]